MKVPLLEEYSFDEILVDRRKTLKKYSSFSADIQTPKTDEELSKEADYMISLLNESGWNMKRGEVKFEKLDGMSGHHDYSDNITRVSKKYIENQSIRVYATLLHELFHASDIRYESEVELNTLEALSELSKKDSKYEPVLYKSLHEFTDAVLELKSRKEKIPKNHLDEVEMILGKKKSKFLSFLKVSGDDINYFEGRDNGFESYKLKEYYFKPYSAIKKSIKDGKDTISTSKGDLKIDGILEVWKSL